MVLKHLFDIIAAATGLILLSPVMLAIAVLIKLRMPGPVLFKQERIGFQGNRFNIYKFRTMQTNHGGNSITIKGESRITPFGAWLRRYKLDELPELWNILKGDMSFVGPRPDVPGYADKLSGEDRNILKLRPGLTGAASLVYNNEDEILAKQDDPVKYNDEILYPAKVKIDLHYYYNQSFTGDIVIILKTIYRTLANS